MKKNNKLNKPAILMLSYSLLILSAYTLIESLSSGITWKIVFSSLGFIGFLGIAGIHTKHLCQSLFTGSKQLP